MPEDEIIYNWNPPRNVVNLNYVQNNIVNFIKAHQADALFRYHGGITVKPFLFLTDTIDSIGTPNLPALVVKRKTKQIIPGGGDLIEPDYTIGFEGVVFSSDETAVEALTGNYSLALQSLVSNIPDDELLSGMPGVGITGQPALGVTVEEVGFSDHFRGYIQIFNIQANFRFYADIDLQY